MDDKDLKINTIRYLYHGTNQEFDDFDFRKAKLYKDFGRGYYLTSDFAQAQKWAQRKSRKGNRAYVYRYEINEAIPKDWKILELLQYDKEWIDFISKCRIEGMETDHDIIYDRMADSQGDKLSDYLQDYVDNMITADEVIDKIKWADKSNKDQFCFKNEKAVQLLQDRRKCVLEKDMQGRWKITEKEW